MASNVSSAKDVDDLRARVVKGHVVVKGARYSEENKLNRSRHPAAVTDASLETTTQETVRNMTRCFPTPLLAPMVVVKCGKVVGV